MRIEQGFQSDLYQSSFESSPYVRSGRWCCGGLFRELIGSQFERLYVQFTRRSIPLEWWFGRGLPLHPYLREYLISFIRKERKRNLRSFDFLLTMCMRQRS